MGRDQSTKQWTPRIIRTIRIDPYHPASSRIKPHLVGRCPVAMQHGRECAAPPHLERLGVTLHRNRQLLGLDCRVTLLLSGASVKNFTHPVIDSADCQR